MTTSKTLLEFLQKYNFELQSLQSEINHGILSAVDAEMQKDLILEKISKTKNLLLQQYHKNQDGSPKKISYHEPTQDYPNGYWYTKISNNYKPKRANYDALVDCLLEYYKICVKPTFETVFNLAIDLLEKTSSRCDKTIGNYLSDYKRYIPFDFSQTPIEDITVDDIKKLCLNVVTSDDSPCKESAFLRFKGILNIAFNYACDHNCISSNPLLKVDNSEYIKLCEGKEKKAENKVMPPEDTEALTKLVNSRFDKKRYKTQLGYYVYGYMILLAIETGMRSAELCALKWSDVMEDKIWIHSQILEKQKPHSSICVNWTKNEKKHEGIGRYFPITEKIREILSQAKEAQEKANLKSEYVFSKKGADYILPKDYEDALGSACKSLGLKKHNNHAIRMYLNSYVFIPMGIDVTDRAKLLGHSVETNLKRYSFEKLNYLDLTRDLLDKKVSEPQPNPCNEM